MEYNIDKIPPFILRYFSNNVFYLYYPHHSSQGVFMSENQPQYIIDVPYAYKMWDKEKNTELSPENTTVSGNINRVIPKGYYY